MARSIYILICVLGLFACNNRPEQPVTQAIEGDTATVQTTEPVYYDYTGTVLDKDFADSTKAQFSNDTLEDVFTFYMPAGDIGRTTSVLRILNPQGRIIYEHSFATKDLINGYALEGIKTADEMKAYMYSTAHDILSSGLVNADTLKPDDFLMQPDIDFVNKPAFDVLKGTPRVYLHYCLNEEWHHYMVYDEVTGKVVSIADCC
ncbi:MAG TPA: hypothetical protein PLW44_18525 [Chitinophagales bacterium]|nr:hypothetical protein [Chitinophagales bacterium]